MAPPADARYVWFRKVKTMSLSPDPTPELAWRAPRSVGNTALKLVFAGAGLAFLAALLLWWRFGPTVFVDALNAVWTCL